MREYHAKLSFEHAPTVWEYVLDTSFFSGIEGPLGSGKSIGSCAKIMKNASTEPVQADGWMRTRTAVIRNTYPELRSTTIKTWLELFPEDKCGSMRLSHPITHNIKIPPRGRNPGLDLEVMFLALDRPGDVKHLKSLDLTNAWVNEATEVPVEIIDMLTGRIGRYPPKVDMATGEKREPPRNVQIMADTNSPDDQNWWHKAKTGGGIDDIQYETPDGELIEISWNFLAQPAAVLECEELPGGGFIIAEPGFVADEVKPTQVLHAAGRHWCVNSDAENLPWLRPGYYAQQISNKTLEWVRRYLQAKSVFMAPGKPWVPEFSDTVMCMKLTYDPNLPLIAGMDIGGGTLQPAIVWGQLAEIGQWRILAELSRFETGAQRFVEIVNQTQAQLFPGAELAALWIDPAAVGRDQLYEVVVGDFLKSRGLPADYAPSNDPDVRRDALALAMGRMLHSLSGKAVPGFVIDPEKCPMLRAALAGKWFRKRVQIAGDERYHERPDKNAWSHVGDAASYLLLGGGEHRNLLGRAPMGGKADPWRGVRQGNAGPMTLSTDFNPFDI